jgi:hypothetical protein
MEDLLVELGNRPAKNGSLSQVRGREGRVRVFEEEDEGVLGHLALRVSPSAGHGGKLKMRGGRRGWARLGWCRGETGQGRRRSDGGGLGQRRLEHHRLHRPAIVALEDLAEPLAPLVLEDGEALAALERRAALDRLPDACGVGQVRNDDEDGADL